MKILFCQKSNYAFWGIMLILSWNSSKAQDTVYVTNEVFLAFDAWGLAEQIIVPGKYSMIGKMGWVHGTSYQVSVDGGFMNFSRQENDSAKSYHYLSSGYYARIGYERNIFRRNLPGERNLILVGIHVGYSETQHRGENIVIPDKYWGARYFSFEPITHQSIWIDFSVGLRANVSRRIALGWEAKLCRIIYSSGGNSITPYYLAGYGKSQNKFSLGLNYYLYYTLAW